jgi:hypothetical protein
VELLRNWVTLGLIAGICMAVCPVAKAQLPNTPNQGESESSSGSQSEQDSGNRLKLLTGLPSRLKGGFQASFGLGESYYREKANAGQNNAVYAYTNANAALAYNFRRKQSQYVFDYHASAQYYPRSTNQNIVAHDLGLSQSLSLGRHFTITNTYRFTLTPNYAPGLLGDAAAVQASLVSPVITVTNAIPPALVNPLPTFTAPGDGLLTFRSVLMSQTAQSNVSYHLGAQTSAFVGAGVQKTQLTKSDLFGSNLYSGSLGITHNFSARTNGSLAYQAGLSDFSTTANRNFSQGVVFSIGRQVLRNVTLQIGVGPSLVRSKGLQAITLPPDLAALLGRTTVYRNTSQSIFGWIGNASLGTQWHRTNITVGYNRGVTSMTGLASIANQQASSISLGRQLGRRTQVSLSGSYLISQFLAIQTPLRLKQWAATATISHQISSSIDMAALADYSKVLSSGLPLNGEMYGISLQYHFPHNAR